MTGLAIDNFVFVELEKYLKIQYKTKEKMDEHRPIIQHWVELRDNSTPCEVCGCTPIWATGSAMIDDAMCFTCITGESDASDDYEVI